MWAALTGETDVVRILDRSRSPFRLRLTDGELRLRHGEHVVGRGTSCDVVLDDSQVSRQHARLDVTDERVFIVDLGSVNGSFVNGKRLRGSRELRPGDQFKLGNTTLELVIGPDPNEDDVRETVQDLDLPPPSLVGEEDIPTRRAEGLEVGAKGAEMAYAAGQPAQAERFLAGYLAGVLSELEAGRPLPDHTVHEALRLSLRLAGKAEKPAWFDYAIKLLWAHDALPPEEQLSEMKSLASRLAIDRQLLAGYAGAMDSGSAAATASEQKVLNQLFGLCRALGVSR